MKPGSASSRTGVAVGIEVTGAGAGTPRRAVLSALAPRGLALCLLALCAAGAAPIRAASAWYQMEVVIFAQGGESAWAEGHWREIEGPLPIADNTVELLAGLDLGGEATGGAGRRHAFRTLAVSALELGEVVNRLERSDEYQVLLHTAWRQPGYRPGRAPGVRLGSLRGAAADGRFITAPGADVEGTLRLWRRRFLYVDVDLAFGGIEAWSVGSQGVGAEPNAAREGEGASPADGRGGRLPVARLTRSLRVEVGRLQYIDHPLVGVLLLVRNLP